VEINKPSRVRKR